MLLKFKRARHKHTLMHIEFDNPIGDRSDKCNSGLGLSIKL